MTAQTLGDVRAARLSKLGPQARAFRAVTDHVLIKPDVAPEKVGNIHVPQAYQQDRVERQGLHKGLVVAMGPGLPVHDHVGDETWPVVGGRKRWPPPEGVAAGDRVYFERATAQRIMLDDEPYLMIRDPQIAMVIEEE